jgi:hypothetical protein
MPETIPGTEQELENRTPFFLIHRKNIRRGLEAIREIPARA